MIDLATQVLGAKLAMTQQSAGIAVLKKSHEMQTELLETLMEAALSPPPEGQGARIDKRA